MGTAYKGLILSALLACGVFADTELLNDNFDSGVRDSTKWEHITATGHASFDELVAGGTITWDSNMMWIKDALGAYKTVLLPVDGRGEIVVLRNTYVSSGSGTLVSRPDEIVAEDGTVLMRWGYYNYDDGTLYQGFGGLGDTLVTAIWNIFFDETITYDPLTGLGSYSSANGTTTITGIPLPEGQTNLYLRGSAYAVGSATDYKAFQNFTVTQTDRKLLTVSSAVGSPVPNIGTNAYDTGSTVTCSVANVTVDGIDYECTGWSGTGSVPASGTTNEVVFTLSDDSSITWLWHALLLKDDFEDGVLNTSKWTVIRSTKSGLDSSSAGNSLIESNGVMNITYDTVDNGGAYQTAALPVNDRGEIVIERRTQVHAAGSTVAMTDELKSEDGTLLLKWGYYNYNYFYSMYGFGSSDAYATESRVTGVWDAWFDEVITYDPISGEGSYAINGGMPVTISGTAMPIGETNVVLRGGTSDLFAFGNFKQFDEFTVSQEKADTRTLLTVVSAQGVPSPAAGLSAYDSGSVVTCSVEDVTVDGIRYHCTGWTGTGSVPATGATNELVVTLDEDSSVTWQWEALDAVLTVFTYYGSPTPSLGDHIYSIGSVVTCSVDNVATYNGIRYQCTGWSSGTGDVPVSGTTNSVVVTVTEDSYLKWEWEALDAALTVYSAYGEPEPSGTTVYPLGTVVTCSVEDVIGPETRHLSTGWSGNAFSPNLAVVTLSESRSITWNWQTDHWLDVSVEGSGTVSHASGFYGAGTSQTLVAMPDDGWVLELWTGDASGIGDASITMNEPKSVTAVFAGLASVENLSVAQVEGERVVEVSYDVGGTRPLLVDLEVYQGDSNLNAYVTGDLGMVSGTNNVIRWNAGASWNHNVDELTFKLLSEDGLPFYAPYEGGAVSIPRTLQTASYTTQYGEDHDFEAGAPWPEPRFTDNGDNTITDNMTGLMWAKNYISGNWGSCMASCENSTLAGHDDWRLPNVREMRSLLSNYSRHHPTLETGYFNFTSGSFWTSTSMEYNPPYKFYVSASSGTAYPNANQGNTLYGLAVRGSATGSVHLAKTGQTTSFSDYTTEDGDLQSGEAWPAERFTDHGDGTVTDNLTGIMWWTDASRKGSLYQAMATCYSLTVGGHTDWRLPNINELESLIDYGQKYPTPCIPVGHPFSSLRNSSSYYDAYWSNTTLPDNTGYAFAVQFYDGRTMGLTKGYNACFLVCRGGREIQETIPEPAGQYPLPQTGQTNSYTVGDDGATQAGIASPDPRFQRTGTYTVLDNLTGLLWYISMDNQSYYEYWHSAVSDADAYVNVVDWRLPNVREMLSLMDLGQSSPALPEGHPFQNVQTNANYWTSTTLYTNGSSYAWQVNLGDGRTSIANRFELNGQFYAMVYGPTAQPQAYVHKTGQTNSVVADDDGANQRGYEQTGDRFTDNGNYTVSDNRTGLMWLQSVEACGEMTWAEAVDYCESLNFGGYTDWRLPNARELESMVDYSRGGYDSILPKGHPLTDFDLRGGSSFWSSTTLSSDTNIAVNLNLYTGMLSGWTKDQELKVWPVRGGN